MNSSRVGRSSDEDPDGNDETDDNSDGRKAINNTTENGERQDNQWLLGCMKLMGVVNNEEKILRFVLNGQNAFTRDSALQAACMFHKENYIELLLENGADPSGHNKQGRCAVDVLLQFWPRIRYDDYHNFEESLTTEDAEQRTTLQNLRHGAVARQNNARKCFQLLIKHFGLLDRQKRRQVNMFLHTAVKSNIVDAFEELVAAGADLDFCDIYGYSPLILAAKYGTMQILRSLLRHGVDVNARTVRGFTTLHYVAQGTLIPVTYILELVEYGADVNATDNAGDTPLHIAADALQLRKLQYLLNLGADPDIKNNKGETTLYRLLNSPQIDVHQGYGRLILVRLLTEMTLISLRDGSGSLPFSLCQNSEESETLARDLLPLSMRVPTLQNLSRQRVKRCLGPRRLTDHYIDQLDCTGPVKKLLLSRPEQLR